MVITIYDVFELNRVMHNIISQQSSYNIQTAFKIHSLIKWLDDTETFAFDRMKMIFGKDDIDVNDPTHIAFLMSQIPFVETSLTIDELLKTDGNVNLEVSDVSILEKMLLKTED